MAGDVADFTSNRALSCVTRLVAQQFSHVVKFNTHFSILWNCVALEKLATRARETAVFRFDIAARLSLSDCVKKKLRNKRPVGFQSRPPFLAESADAGMRSPLFLRSPCGPETLSKLVPAVYGQYVRIGPLFSAIVNEVVL